MSYVTIDQVRAIVDTDITNAELVTIIEGTDAIMDLKLDTGSIGAHVLRLISRTWTAYRCMLKDPNASGVGEYSEDRDASLKMLKGQLDEYLSIADGGISFRYDFAESRWPIV